MYESTRNTKLKNFQFRLLHNSIITNVQLKNWNIKDSDMCTFCNSTPETMIHLMLNCDISRRIWEEIYNFIAQESGIRINLKKEEIILGIYEKSFQNFFNHINMTVKQYIYASRCLGKFPNARVAIEKIKFERQIEYLSAVKNNSLNTFNLKWSYLENVALQ